MKIVSITTDNKISLIDISKMRHQFPYARKVPNQSNYYYVFDDGDALSETTSVNKLCGVLAKTEVLGNAYVVKSDVDITGLAFENDCITCTSTDLEVITNLCRV